MKIQIYVARFTYIFVKKNFLRNCHLRPDHIWLEIDSTFADWQNAFVHAHIFHHGKQGFLIWLPNILEIVQKLMICTWWIYWCRQLFVKAPLPHCQCKVRDLSQGRKIAQPKPVIINNNRNTMIIKLLSLFITNAAARHTWLRKFCSSTSINLTTSLRSTFKTSGALRAMVTIFSIPLNLSPHSSLAKYFLACSYLNFHVVIFFFMFWLT